MSRVAPVYSKSSSSTYQAGSSLRPGPLIIESMFMGVGVDNCLVRKLWSFRLCIHVYHTNFCLASRGS